MKMKGKKEKAKRKKQMTETTTLSESENASIVRTTGQDTISVLMSYLNCYWPVLNIPNASSM